MSVYLSGCMSFSLSMQRKKYKLHLNSLFCEFEYLKITQINIFQKLKIFGELLFSIKIVKNLWIALLIMDGGTSSPHMGGANATVIIFNDK